MCGLCGILSWRDGAPCDPAVLAAMTDRMAHRGPDGRGVWLEGAVGLGHRRLSIIDVEGGRQPMENETGTVRVVFNGEIYNHRELRRPLEEKGHVFRTRCDTEVLVHLYEELGADFVTRLNGMFAIAVWDARDKTLTLARDRLGIKPLFYYVWRGGIVFASELQALLKHPEVPREIDPRSLHLYLNHQFVPAPRTLLPGVKKLRPAEVLQVEPGGRVKSRIYWRLAYEPKVALSKEEAGEGLAEHLERSVRRRLMSDVPLGAFLSGGIDSSSIVFWMRRHVTGPLRTFSIGFDDPTYNELDYARQMAELLETEHHEEVLTAAGLSVVDLLGELLDEPLADVSMIPTYLVSHLARREVKVCLSGDGGDELLAGYERHLASRLDRNIYRRLPRSLRRRWIEPLAAQLPATDGKKGLADLARRFVEGAAKDPRGEQMRWQTFLPDPWLDRIYSEAMQQQAAAVDRFEAVAALTRSLDGGPLDRELAVELALYLPDDILAKVDRMSMAVSLEVRVPFLDHELVEFAASLPQGFKMRALRGKSILRRAMRRRLPKRILTRRKEGFSIPVKRWLRDELYDRVAATFAGDAVRESPWLQAEGLTAMLDAHRERRGEYSHALWSLFTLALWLERLR